MNDKGKTIVVAIRSLRKFHADVALLLRTADGPLENAGWKPCSKKAPNTATSDGSASINEPHKWMPHYTCRFYENDKRPDIALFISVIMDNLQDPRLVTEPLVSAGYLRYDAEVTNWEWWYCTVASWSPEIVPDGVPHELKPVHLPKAEETYGVKGGKVLARPLVDVENGDKLKALVVDKLLKEMA